MRVIAAALLCLAVTAGCGTKKTSSTLHPKGEAVAEAIPAAGPVLHGEYVAWGESVIEDEFMPVRLMVGSPGAKARVVWAQEPSRGRPEWWFIELEGSPKRVTFVRGGSICEPAPYDQCGAGSDVAVAGSNEDVQFLPRHDSDCGFSPGSHHVDVDRSQIVFSGPYCVPQCAPPYCRRQCGPCWRIAIDDIADREPPRTLVRKSEGLDEVRIAGHFVAARSWKRAAVYDLRSGELVYRVRLPSDFARIDLQSDGKMVAVWLLREGARVGWFSPREPWKHILPIRPLLFHEHDEHVQRVLVRMAANRVALESELSPGKSALVITDLEGRIVQELARFDKSQLRIRDFDFDGKRLTWASQTVLEAKTDCQVEQHRGRVCTTNYVGPTTIYLADLS
jgi:hypothetical protein